MFAAFCPFLAAVFRGVNSESTLSCDALALSDPTLHSPLSQHGRIQSASCIAAIKTASRVEFVTWVGMGEIKSVLVGHVNFAGAPLSAPALENAACARSGRTDPALFFKCRKGSFASSFSLGDLKITSTSTERQKRSQCLAPVLVIISGNSLVFSRKLITSIGFYRCCAPGASAPVVVKHQSPILLLGIGLSQEKITSNLSFKRPSSDPLDHKVRNHP